MARFKLTKNNYYSHEANEHFWSASFVKAMLNCPAGAIAEYHGDFKREMSTALLVGSYVDSAFDGKKAMNEFKTEHPEIFLKSGDLKADFRLAESMVNRAKSDKLFASYMKGQKQKIFTGMIQGIPFKAKLDVYKKDERIVDLKTVRDLKPTYFEGLGRVHPIIGWRWDIQMAIYQELCYQNTGKRLPCYLAIITKEEPANIFVIELPQTLLDSAMEFLVNQLPRLDAMLMDPDVAERCDECAYCRTTKVLTEPEEFEFMFEEGDID